ncbi:MAG: alginate export family protein [Bdellovibrionaceae bacterium]|nr:alginate export family protein [Bdellovibrionales bacterium]MCB9085995.1 alginate export family protein [Pseudobdellovibrionaceae bacterium]
MKKLIALLALAGVASTAFAEGADFSHNAEFRLRYTLDQDQDGNADANPSSTNKWDQRFRWGSTFRAGEKLTAHLGLIHAAQWGANLGAGATNDGIGNLTGIADNQNMLLVNEAYGSWMATDELLIRFGRGGLPMADERVIGLNAWGATQNAFEGVLFTYDKEFARFNMFGVKVAELAGTAGTIASDPEINMYGFAMDWKNLPEWLKMAHIHVLQTNVDQATGLGLARESKMRYGFVLSGDMNNIDYRATYAVNSGEEGAAGSTTDNSGSMMDIEVGYSMPDMMNSRVSFLYHTDTGDDPNTANEDEGYDAFYYTKHDKAGWMDIYGFGNLTFMQLGWSMDLMEEMTLKAQYVIFSQTEKASAAATGANGSGWGGASATEDALGTEIDVEVMKKYEGGFSIAARLGMFTPGDEFKNTTMEDNYNQFMLEGKMTF